MASHRQWLVECHYPFPPSDLLAFCSSRPILFFHALFTTNDAVTGIVALHPLAFLIQPYTLFVLFKPPLFVPAEVHDSRLSARRRIRHVIIFSAFFAFIFSFRHLL